MQSSRPIETDIVLLGAGHAHVEVLRRFTMRPEPGVRLTLIGEKCHNRFGMRDFRVKSSFMGKESVLGIIAGNGVYPFLTARAARQRGVTAIHIAAFENETRPELANHADSIEWMRVGQLGRLLKFFGRAGVHQAIMAGQIAPKNLFDLRPDIRVLMVLSTLKRRNAESLFGALGEELAKAGIQLLPATTFLEEAVADAEEDDDGRASVSPSKSTRTGFVGALAFDVDTVERD